MLNQNQNKICLEIEMCSENESFWIESEIGRTTVEIILKLNVCCYAVDKNKERNFETKLERIKKNIFGLWFKTRIFRFQGFWDLMFLNVHLFGYLGNLKSGFLNNYLKMIFSNNAYFLKLSLIETRTKKLKDKISWNFSIVHISKITY